MCDYDKVSFFAQNQFSEVEFAYFHTLLSFALFILFDFMVFFLFRNGKEIISLVLYIKNGSWGRWQKLQISVTD